MIKLTVASVIAAGFLAPIIEAKNVADTSNIDLAKGHSEILYGETSEIDYEQPSAKTN